MSEKTSSTKATLLFDAAQDIDFVEVVKHLKRPFRNIALEFSDVEVDQEDFALFSSDRMTMRIARGQTVVPRATLETAKRPDNQDTDLSDRIQDFEHTLSITLSDGPEGCVADRVRLAACYHVVRHLLREYDVSLVHWHHTGMLFTTDEFENPVDMQAKVRPRRPVAATKTSARRTARPNASGPMGKGRFAEGHMQVSQNHTRLDESFAQAVAPLPEPEIVPNDAGTAEKSWKDIFPTLEPNEEGLRRSRLAIFASDLIEIEEVKLEAPKDPVGALEQLSVYTMTLTLMVLAFPVGFGMLIYNILGGESLNMTARAMSLTGIVTAMNMIGFAPQLAAFV